MYPSSDVPNGTGSESAGGVINIGIFDGITPAVRVTADPVGMEAVDKAASGSVIVAARVVVVDVGAIKNELAVMN